jgi:Na+/melibiose symporter-like transporter
MNITHPSLVLAIFVRLLGGSNALVGLLPAIRFGFWLLPQYLLAGWIGSQPLKTRIVLPLETGRAAIYGLLAVLTIGVGTSHPQLLLVLFFVVFTLSRVTAGACGLARMDVIGQVVPSQRRARFFAMRNFWGGVLVFGAGMLVRHMLNPARDESLMSSFALLFGLSAVAFLVGVLSFRGIGERPSPISAAQQSLRAQLVGTPELIRRNPVFRHYLLMRILLTMTRLAEPFYPILALDVLGAPASMVGFYLSAMTLAGVVSNLVWQRVDRARGPCFMIQLSSFLTVLTPLLATALPWGMRLLGFTVASHGLLPAYLFTAVFVLAGLSASGRVIGLSALMLDIVPSAERPRYIGLVNTAVGVVSFVPLLSGLIIDRFGFEPVLLAATLLLLGAFLVSLGLRTADEGKNQSRPLLSLFSPQVRSEHSSKSLEERC